MWSFFPIAHPSLWLSLLLFPSLCWYALPSLHFTRFILSVILEWSLYHFTPNYSLSCSSSLWYFLFGLVVCLVWFGVLWLWDLMILLGFDEFARVLKKWRFWDLWFFLKLNFLSFLCFFFPRKISRFMGCGNLVCLLGKNMKLMLWGETMSWGKILTKKIMKSNNFLI